jgi:hypothetical protein
MAKTQSALTSKAKIMTRISANTGGADESGLTTGVSTLHGSLAMARAFP